MRLVSLNAWGGKLWHPLRDWLAARPPDILCLQEVTRAPVASPGWLHYADRYRQLDQRADLFGDVSAVLPRHQAVFAPATRGALQDATGRWVASEHGLGLWVRRDLAIAELQHGFVHGRFRHDGWGPEPVPRAIQVARICDPDSGASLVVAHFHGLRDPAGKGDTPDRAAQAEAVVAQLSRIAAPSDPCVLAGDFNLLPDSHSFAVFARLGLADLVTGRGFASTRTDLYEKAQRLADYLLVNDRVRVEAFDVPQAPIVSDHCPLVLTLGI